MTTTLAILSRIMVRFISRKSWVSGINLHNAVIVGTNKRAVKFAQNLEQSPELGYRVMGFVDQKWQGSRRFQESGYPLLADFQNFPTFLRTHAVDEVIIDLPLNSFYQETSYIVGLCVQQGIIVRFLSDSLYLLFDMKLARAELEEIQDYVILSVYTGAMGGWPIHAKRAFDFLVSFLLIILLSPLFLLVAFLVKLTSPGGPVFFVQDRIGLRKRTIKVIKFRTMVPGAEQGLTALERFNEASGPVFKIKNDPRVTVLGRFLRKTSIDELPQLFNVLKGDMSLVGPGLCRSGITPASARTGIGAASASNPASPVSGKFMAAPPYPSPLRNGCKWIWTTSTAGPCGSISRFWPRPYRRSYMAREPINPRAAAPEAAAGIARGTTRIGRSV